MMQSTILGLVITVTGWTCCAQEPTRLIGQFPDAPQPESQTRPTSVDIASSVSFSTSLPDPSALNPAYVRPVVRAKTISAKFVLINGLHLGLMIADVEMTQRCIASHHCQEGNPLMPSSQAGQLAVGFGLVAYASGVSYWLKKHKSTYWWMLPTGGMVAHTVGVTSGFLNQ